MIPYPPFFPHQYYRKPYTNIHNLNNIKHNNLPKQPIPKSSPHNTNINTFSNHFYNDNTINSNNYTNTSTPNCDNCSSHISDMKCNDSNNNEYEDFINIFGFKLHFDDLLIIALLFFLYKEEINDESLYIALILLLLS